MINEFISAILQIVVFTSIPFLAYLFKARSTKGFWDYIGLKRSARKANLAALLVAVLLVGPLLLLVFVSEEFRAIMLDPESVTGRIKQMGIGIEAAVTIPIAALLKTSLSEEIFFRGFLAKRLIAVTTFQIGNVIQAVVFGLIHILLFTTITHNPFFLVIIFVFPALGAYFQTHINEKWADGSIIPGWIAHGMANLVSYSFVLFAV